MSLLATCLQGSGFKRTLVIGVVAKCLDILTDILRQYKPKSARIHAADQISNLNTYQPSLECPYQTSSKAGHRRFYVFEYRHDHHRYH